jgi:hypothetical protein
MASDDDGFVTVSCSGKAKDPPKITINNGTASPTFTGFRGIYCTKIRVILVKKNNSPNLQVGTLIGNLFTEMFTMDNSMVVESLLNTKSFSNIRGYPKKYDEFLKFFEIKEFQKRNGDTSLTIFFNIKSTIQHTLLKMKTNKSFLQKLRINGIYTFEHPFDGQHLDRLGFFSELLHKSININYDLNYLSSN